MTNLAQLPRLLRDRYSGKIPTYRAIYARVLDGVLPGETRNGRWHFHQEDVAAIAEYFGLNPKEPK